MIFELQRLQESFWFQVKGTEQFSRKLNFTQMWLIRLFSNTQVMVNTAKSRSEAF